MNNYKINIVNKGTDSKYFWCFLSKPASLIQPTVFANSSAFVNVQPEAPGVTNSFTIPLQYKVKAGASNQAVGLETKISALNAKDVNLNDKWLAAYGENPANHTTPNLSLDGTALSPKEIDVQTSKFLKGDEDKAKWFSNLTYGVESQNGFIGITWSPDPGEIYRIEPKVNFYIATGNYKTNQLASITAISAEAQLVTSADFDDNLECTVTRTDDGGWSVAAGPPKTTSSLLDNMVLAHMYLADAQLQLVKSTCLQSLIQSSNTDLTKKKTKEGHIKSVKINASMETCEETEIPNIIITGTITLAAAIGTGFAYMFLSGTRFSVHNLDGAGVRWSFSYNGSEAAGHVRDILNGAAAQHAEVEFSS